MKMTNIAIKVSMGSFDTDLKNATERLCKAVETASEADDHGLCWSTPERCHDIVHAVRFKNRAVVGCLATSPSRIKVAFEQWFGCVVNAMVAAGVEYDGPNDVGHKSMLVEVSTGLEEYTTSVRVFGVCKGDDSYGISLTNGMEP